MPNYGVKGIQGFKRVPEESKRIHRLSWRFTTKELQAVKAFIQQMREKEEKK